MSHHLSTLETSKARTIGGNRIGKRKQKEIVISQIGAPAGEPFICFPWVPLGISPIVDTIVIHKEGKVRDWTISAVTLRDIDIPERR